MSRCPPCFPLCGGTPGDGRAAPPRVTTQSSHRAQRRVRGRHSSLLSPRSPGETSSEAARPGTCGSSAPCNGLVCPVWCGHGSRVGAAGTKMAAQYPAQPSPAQPSPAVMSQSVASLCRPAGRAAVYTDTAPHINTALVLPPSLCGPEPPQRWSRLFCSAVRGPSRRSLSSSCSDPRRPS